MYIHIVFFRIDVKCMSFYACHAMLNQRSPYLFSLHWSVQIHVDLVRSSKQMTGYMCLRHEARRGDGGKSFALNGEVGDRATKSHMYIYIDIDIDSL